MLRTQHPFQLLLACPGSYLIQKLVFRVQARPVIGAAEGQLIISQVLRDLALLP